MNPGGPGGGLGRGFGGSSGGLLVEETGFEDTDKGCSYLNWEVLGFPLSFVPFSSPPPVADFCSTVDLASPVPGFHWPGSFRSIPGRVGLGKTPAPRRMRGGGGGGGGSLPFLSSSLRSMNLLAFQHPSAGIWGGSL